MFATAEATGNLSVWNLNSTTEVPLYQLQASTRALNKLRWSDDGRHIAAGDSGGGVVLSALANDVRECVCGAIGGNSSRMLTGRAATPQVAVPRASARTEFEATLSTLRGS